MSENQGFKLLPFNIANDDDDDDHDLGFSDSDSNYDSSEENTSDREFIDFDDSESENCKSLVYPKTSVTDFLKEGQDRKEELREKKKLGPKPHIEISTSIKPSTLGKKLLADKSFFDVWFKTNDDVEIGAHKCVIVATSDYFAAMLKGSFKEKKDKIIPIQVAFFWEFFLLHYKEK